MMIIQKSKIKISTPQDCKDLIFKIKDTLYKSIIHYWNIPEDYGLIATLLGPHCKFLSFVSQECQSTIHSKLKLIYSEMKLKYSDHEREYHEENLTN